MELKYTEFKNRLLAGESYPIYLFQGEEGYFINNGINLIKEKLVSEPSLNFAELNGEKLTCSELLSSLESYPFMSDKRVTLVKEFYPDKNFFNEGLKYYLEDPLSESILVIANTKKHDALLKYSSVTVVNCAKADESACVMWIKAECLKQGVNIDGERAKLIATYCLADMMRIEKEIEKLVAFVGKGGTIDEVTINDLVSRDADYKIYQMTEYIANKKISLALSVIEDMLKKGEPPQLLIISIYKHFRRLLHIAISDKTTGELASIFKIKEYAVSKAKEQAKLFKPKALKKAVDMLCEIDYKSKSGQIDINEGLWLALFNIMTEN